MQSSVLLDNFSSQSDSTPSLPDLAPLDNPIWNSLQTEHRAVALGGELALRFPPAFGPLTGMAVPSVESYDAARALAGPGGIVALFFSDPPTPPSNWEFVLNGFLNQMIYTAPQAPEPIRLTPDATLRRLTHEDVPAMLALAKLAEPGPFAERTIELGAFFGIFHAGRLMAMAGQRLHLDHFIEVSAVCTHPEARGRGYARAVMTPAIADILKRGKIPFLHTLPDNRPAIHVYETLGFTLRRPLHLAVLRNNG